MKSTTQFLCSQCGYVSSKWLGRCPECGSWNSFTEEKIEDMDYPYVYDKVRFCWQYFRECVPRSTFDFRLRLPGILF